MSRFYHRFCPTFTAKLILGLNPTGKAIYPHQDVYLF